MTATVHTTWHDANQRHLMAALGDVRSLLERHVAGLSTEIPPSAEGESVQQEIPGASDEAFPAPALDGLCELFGLSSFERRILLLCAGVELDGSFAPLCSAAHGDSRAYPDFSLALAAFPDAHWSALVPTAPLRYWRLIEAVDNGSLTTSPLRIDERILHYLAGVSHADERLIGIIQPVAPPTALAPSHQRTARLITEAWGANRPGEIPVIQLCGQDQSDRRDVAAAACQELGLRLTVLPAVLIPTEPRELENLARLWEREAALEGSALLLECRGGARPEGVEQHLPLFVERMRSGLIVSSRDRLSGWQKDTVTLEVEKPLQEEQRQFWREAANVTDPSLVDSLTAQFNLSSRDLRSMAAAVTSAEPSGERAADLWDACRLQTRPRLENLVQRIEPAAAGTIWSFPRSRWTPCGRLPCTSGSGRGCTENGALPPVLREDSALPRSSRG